jgi:hypothetical protein
MSDEAPLCNIVRLMNPEALLLAEQLDMLLRSSLVRFERTEFGYG